VAKWTQKEDRFLEETLKKRLWTGYNLDEIVVSYRRRFPKLSALRTDSAIRRRIPSARSLVEPEDYFA